MLLSDSRLEGREVKGSFVPVNQSDLSGAVEGEGSRLTPWQTDEGGETG